MRDRQVKHVAVIGAGAMGLAAAYQLLQQGYKVDVYEKNDVIGGMSASFDFDGMRIEKFYHFVCGPDYPLFGILKELDIFNKLKWTETKMGFYYQGQLYKWGNPLYLLNFSQASLSDRLRYGVHLFLASKRSKWADLDTVDALTWIKKAIGERAYNIFWKPLFELKFYDYQTNISAAWIWTRIKRVALSRKNIFVERMGYIEGGSDTFFSAIANAIEKMGGHIYLNQPVQNVNVVDNKITGIYLADGEEKIYDYVISTVPLPYVNRLIPDLPKDIKEKLNRANNVGVVCVILKLTQALTENFWLNINDDSIQIPGMIEYSNLNPLTEKVLYVPFYLHKDNPQYTESDDQFISKVFEYAAKVNPHFSGKWVLAEKVHRYEYAQPVCTPGYLETIPAIKSDIQGLYIADTSYYYPEDRSISESVRLGREIAVQVMGDS